MHDILCTDKSNFRYTDNNELPEGSSHKLLQGPGWKQMRRGLKIFRIILLGSEIS